MIACDRVPTGLPEIVSGIASQKTLGFELDLIEVVPYVRNENPDGILFVPTNRLSTEIVARTAVTVTYRQGDAKPSTVVETTSLEEIEQQVEVVRRGSNPLSRVWTAAEVEEAFRKHGDATALDLLIFAKEHSADGQLVSPENKVNATFGFTIRGRRSNGQAAKVMLFYCTLGWGNIWLNLQAASRLVSEAVMAEFRTRLKVLFGDQINLEFKDAGIKLPALASRIKDFEALVLWFRDQSDLPQQ